MIHLNWDQILNLGTSDEASFVAHQESYNKTMFDLHASFESTYISLVKAIRQLAYPNREPSGLSSLKPAPLQQFPIFIMRPLHGALEHATLNVAARLRADGDSAVFWLDTSGWLVLPDAPETSSADFFLDSSVDPPIRRITELGNQRVAIFLHMHLCRFLASETEKCAFLPPDVYEGKLSDPEDAVLERWMEDEREKGLKEAFSDAE